MLKIAIKVLIILFVCVAIGSYLVYLKTGRLFIPWISTLNSPASFSAPELSLPKLSSEPSYRDFSSNNTPQSQTYKWRENGQWVYGDKPPKGVDATRIDTQQ
jgi:hypothetical protein